jgi:hypothetical protein
MPDAPEGDFLSYVQIQWYGEARERARRRINHFLLEIKSLWEDLT